MHSPYWLIVTHKVEPNKTYLQQIASNYLPNTEFKYFMKLYEDYNKVPILFLINHTTLSSDNQEKAIIKQLLLRQSK